MPERKNKGKITETKCAFCGAQIIRLTCQIKTERVYCNRRCQAKGCPRPLRQPRPLADRFWARVDKTPGLGPQGECWEWRGTFTGGYGSIWHQQKGRAIGTHKASWEIHNGPIPSGLCVLHRCDNPPCVRPDHLFLGTHQDNIQDMLNKGRGGRGGLNAEKVREIRQIGTRVSPTTLGRRYGVHRKTISEVINGHLWKSVQ